MKKTIRSMVMVLMALFSVMLIRPVTAQAELYIPEKMVLFQTKDLENHNINLQGVTKTSAVTKLKSSRSKVASVSKFKYGNDVYVSVKPNKPGKTTVSFNYKINGKTEKAKVAVIVYKYQNPVSTLKIGSKNYASKFNKNDSFYAKKKLRGKLVVKPRSGWKLLYMSSYNSKDGSNYKTVNNKSKITLKSGYVLNITLMNKKTDAQIELCLRVE